MAWSDHVHAHGPLTALAEDLWWVKGSLPRVPVPRNMVVWRHPQGGLLLYSPVALDDTGMAALDALGDVRWVAVPCEYHRADCAAFKARYPDAQLLCPRCSEPAVSKVAQPDGFIEDVFPTLGIDVRQPAGTKPFEVHPILPLSSGQKAVVFTDLVMNMGADPPKGFSGAIVKLIGSVKPLGITGVGRFFFLKDKEAFRAHLSAIAPQVDMVLCLHGPPVVDQASERLREAAARV